MQWRLCKKQDLTSVGVRPDEEIRQRTGFLPACPGVFLEDFLGRVKAETLTNDAPARRINYQTYDAHPSPF